MATVLVGFVEATVRTCIGGNRLKPITSSARTSGDVTLREGEPLRLVNASCTCDGVWVIQSP